jgi:hypothetical protein
MTTTTTGIAATTPDHQAEDRVDAAARRVHAAEGQLHTARESGVHAWQSAAAETLHAALEEYLSAQTALRFRRDAPVESGATMTELHAVPLIEAHQPGWKVTHGKRTYILWGPRPEVDHGVTAGGTPVRSAGRAQWAACRDTDTDTSGNFWRAETLDAVLAPMAADVEAAFRAVVTP